MIEKYLFCLAIVGLVHNTLQNTNDNEVEDVNPLSEAASEFLSQQNIGNIGGMVGSYLENGGAQQIGNILSNLDADKAGQILSGIGSLMGAAGGNEGNGNQGGIDPAIIGNVLGMLAGSSGEQKKGSNGGFDLGTMMQLAGAFMGNQQETTGKKQKKSQDNESSFDMGTVMQLASAFMSNQQESSPSEPNIAKSKGKSQEPGLDIGSMIQMASMFMGSQGSKKNSNDGGNLMDLLPVIAQTVSSFIGPDAEKRSKSHSEHSSMLPPILEKAHIYFDHFIHSEMGKNIISLIGADKMFRVFQDEKGRFDYGRFGEKLENHSFRRHWIRMVTDRIAEMIKLFADPKVHKQYIETAPMLVNALLATQGFPKSATLDLQKPTESISKIVNYAAKKHLGMKISSKEYVKPAVQYTKELYALSQKRGLLTDSLNSKELSDKLADTLNLEIIEPIARVSRAYRFAILTPVCDKYVFCKVNEENQNDQLSLPGLKSGLAKVSSLAASWFVSEHSGTPFWNLYTIITEKSECQKYHNPKCDEFHTEEYKVTTEYVHNEL